MCETVNCMQAQKAGRQRIVDRFKAATQKKTAAVRGWYDRRSSRNLKSMVESESEDSAAQIEEFFTHSGVVELCGSKRRPPEIHSEPSRAALRKPEYPEIVLEIPCEAGSVSSLSTMLPRASSSTISLPSTFSMGSTSALEPGAPQPSLPGPHCVIDTPDDFERFRSKLRNQVELESIPALPKDTPRVHTKSFKVDSTPIPIEEEQPKPQFKAYVSEPDPDTQSPVKFQAYSAGSKLKHRHVGYIPPSLQSGYINGVPPALRAAHHAANSRGKSTGMAAGHGGQTYSWPLVDFYKEMFVNADPSQPTLSARYQEPRIPSMEFSGRGLEDEMKAVLDKFDQPVAEKEAVQVQDRAWMSPSSPLHPLTYEMEARIPVEPTKAVKARCHPRVLTVGAAQKQERTTSTVSRRSDEERRVKDGEYNWPRFSDDLFTDPAEEHSRQYRRRRRETRRELARHVNC
ncbi:uncharacterized protein Z519_03145 [Cladophialophora bantiana CBS 173.52]|uniref:Uncharacterized protein n=1 Tax=Cladophialophora bantiana (strain ATCC 10958 / CBS 173.52 / CDC B-1940 / NIH 8579) TaxID=1442370 RepID=A0A0D2IH90_CLAB1|nr:uncharacterized protein Z519_03145 [Cladophialophora bantiana CBS 173.52]KIW96079.1 hypothetical protein Z519_03145 [Cladophialophora bantiana CBS 173.52]